MKDRTWGALEARIAGRLLRAGDAHFDVARQVWNAAIDRHPAAILVCANELDVVEGVRFAAMTGLRVTVRGGGHNVAGRAVHEGALVIDLSALRSVQVDPRARVARVAGGATWRDVDAATGAFGLATTGGMISTTGVAGLTLGGGIGWLMREQGLACDALRSTELVLADGRRVRTSSAENADLFWALHGDGTRIGVAVQFEFALREVSQVLGGALWYRAERTPEVLQAYREFALAAPDQLTSVATITTAPPAPFLPPGLRMEPVAVIGVCGCGDLAASRAAIQQLRRALPPDADTVAAMPYPALQQSLDPTAPYGMHNYWKARTLIELDDTQLAVLAEWGARLPSPLSMIHCHALGGAVARGPRGVDGAAAGGDDPAADLRRHAWLVNFVATWPPAPPEVAAQMRSWARNGSHALTRGVAPRNFQDADDDEATLPDSDPIRARLERVRRDYDPTQLFA
jgi:FAD/FMN-containing dehydrogenase